MTKTFSMREMLRAFKGEIWNDVKTFLSLSSEQHGIKMGGERGNITLTSFDGKHQVKIAVNDTISFNEKLQVAKHLIDNCIKRWSQGSRPEIKVLVDDAFQVDKQGNISTTRVLGLRRLNIADPEWKAAMDAITESISVIDSKTYMRFYERTEQGQYVQIPLDVAAL